MKRIFSLGRALARSLSPQKLVGLAVDVFPQVWKKIPPEQHVPFLTEVVANNLGTLMAGLSHQERVALLNNLLPIIAREFPLAEADFLSAFDSPGDRYAHRANRTNDQ